MGAIPVARIRKLDTGITIAVLVLSWLFSCLPASAAEVALLIEQKTALYQQAAQSFEKSFGNPEQLSVRQANGDARDIDAQLEAIRKDQPRLVVAIGTRAAQAARQRLRGVPLLYCLALNPNQNQLVGSNIGGIALNVDPAQQMAAVRKLLPQLRTIGVIYDEPTSGSLVRQAQRYLKTVGINLVARDARGPQDAARLIEDLQDKVDAFWMLWDPVVANPANFKLLVSLSLKNRVPVIAPAAPFVEEGALMSVEVDYANAGRLAAAMAREVLGGKSAGAVMVKLPAEPVVTINGEVARRLSVHIPPDMQADILQPVDRR